MFDLEASIQEWRQQMQAAGIRSPAMEELECHLREAIAEQIHCGIAPETALTAAVQQLGQTELLQAEFAKIGGTSFEKIKQLFCTLAGIPNPQLVTNMNTSLHKFEPRWATYLKSTVFVLPALGLWLACCVFVLPKLKDICAAAGLTFPTAVRAALTGSDLVKNNLILLALGASAILILLEWRPHRWARYRRLVFGVLVFGLNSAVLVLFAILLVLACIAAPMLLHAK